MRVNLVALFLAVASVPSVASVATAESGMLPADVTTADVCAVIPGDAVANAVGATLVGARLVRPDGSHARCVYTVERPAPGRERVAFVLWLHRPGDFDELRTLQENPVTAVEGLGDGAFVSSDGESGRHDLFVLVRGVAAVEVTGPDAEGVRKVGSAAVERIRAAR